jgi:hypothetical protein
VKHLSRFKWQVTSPFVRESTYVVEKLIDDGEDGETHFSSDCDYWEEEGDPEHIRFEVFCRECNICVEMYSCECQGSSKRHATSICWHIHKVHMWTLEVINPFYDLKHSNLIHGACNFSTSKSSDLDP